MNGDPEPSARAGEIAYASQFAIEVSQQFAELYDPDLDPGDIITLNAEALASTGGLAAETTAGTVTGQILQMTTQDRAVSAQNLSDICTAGGRASIQETANSTSLDFRACRISGVELEGLPINIFIDGGAQFAESTKPGTFTESATVEFRNLNADASIGRNLSLNLDLNGMVSFGANAANDAEIEITNLTMSLSSQCKALNESLSFNYNILQRIQPDGSGGIETRIDGNGSLSGSLLEEIAGTYSIETLNPIRYDALGQAYEGTVRTTSDGTTVVIRYVQGGLFVDDQFYTNAEFGNEFGYIEDDIRTLTGCIEEEISPILNALN